MIILIDSIINPAFIVEVHLSTGVQSCDGGYYISTGGHNHKSPTKTAVVVEFSTGKTKVYGGADAHTIWLALYGKPLFTEELAVTATLNGHGISVDIHTNGLDPSAWLPITYSWACNAPSSMMSDDLALALFNLLIDNGYIDKSTMSDIEDKSAYVTFDGGLSIVYKDQGTDLIIAYS